MGKLKEFLADLKNRPWAAHLLRMQDRFSNRLGNQFAGAITYFSVLALVPVLMFAFAALGFTLTVLRPDMLQAVSEAITGRLSGMGGEDLGGQISTLIQGFLKNWQAVGIVGLLSAVYSASGWAGNLKKAIRAQTRPDFDMTEEGPNFLLEKLVDLVLLLGLFVLIPLTFALANISTTLTGWLVGVLNLEAIPGIATLLRFVGPIGSGLAGWVLFMYVLSVFPELKFPFRAKAWASVIGSVGLAVLQYSASGLIGAFMGNPAAALFGPVIVLMLFFNLFARLILYMAAWMATAVQQANPVQLQEIDEPLARLDTSPITEADVRAAEQERQREEALAKAGAEQEDQERTFGERLRTASGLPLGGDYDPDQHRPDPTQATPEGAAVSAGSGADADDDGRLDDDRPAPDDRGGDGQGVRAAAVRNARSTMQVGWVTGAIAGMGLGAVLAAVTGYATRFLPGSRDEG